MQLYDEAKVNRLLDVLRPKPTDYSASTPLFTVTAKEFGSKATQKEKWYGTRYQVSRGYTRFSPKSVVKTKRLHAQQSW